MKVNKKFITPLLVIVGCVIVAFAVAALPGSSKDDKPKDDKVAQQEKDKTSTESDNKKAATFDGKAYNYVAQSGDSYTKMARKAIQAYVKANDVEFSDAKIVYAETNLTKQAGSPLLEVGQKVSIDAEAISKLVESAKNLSTRQLTAWQYYVQFVDFNTDAVGEPAS